MGRYRGRYRGGSSSMNMLNLVVMMLALGGLLYAGERIATVMSTAFSEVTEAPEEEGDPEEGHTSTPLERGLDVVRSRVHFARNLALREASREIVPSIEAPDGDPGSARTEPSYRDPATPPAESADGDPDALPDAQAPPLPDPSGDVFP